MLTIENMRLVVDSLCTKTRYKRISWRVAEDRVQFTRSSESEMPLRQSVASMSYIATFPHVSIMFSRFDFADGPSYAEFSFRLIEGTLLGRWRIREGDEDWRLVDALSNSLSSEDHFTAIIKDVEEATDANPPMPPIGEHAADFFTWVRGQWSLTFFKGDKGRSEDVRIDSEGNYYTQASHDVPRFALRNVFYDSEGKTVSFAKVIATGERKGRVFQTEVLEISEDRKRMKGFAQHDGHQLIYTRVPQPAGA